MKLALIPAGDFEMGGSETLEDLKKAFPVLEGLSQNPAVAEVLESERPQHKVRITKSFYIGASNVTVGEFRQFVLASGWRTDAEH